MMSPCRTLVVLLCLLMALPSGAAMSWPGGDEPESPTIVETAASGGCHGHAAAGAAEVAVQESGADPDRSHVSDCCTDNCLCACVLPAMPPPRLALTQVWSTTVTATALPLPAPRAVDGPPLRPPITV